LNEQGSVLSAIGFVPVALWELSLGIWLTFKGFNRSAPILTAPAVEVGVADTSAAAVAPGVVVATKAAAV
jgi:hypothetical protein